MNIRYHNQYSYYLYRNIITKDLNFTTFPQATPTPVPAVAIPAFLTGNLIFGSVLSAPAELTIIEAYIDGELVGKGSVMGPTFSITVDPGNVNYIGKQVVFKIADVFSKTTYSFQEDDFITDFKLWIKNNSKSLDKNIQQLQKNLINVSKKHLNTVLPGYTHLQIAQPITLAHHVLAYVEMIGRDRTRLEDCLYRLNENPLGAAALAGTSFPIDRKYTTKELGFREPTKNAMDTVSDRDLSLIHI